MASLIKIPMIESLFTFPIILMDGKNEQKKSVYSEDPDPDMIYAEADVPFYDFLCVVDRWLPTQESLEKAMDGKFEACYVDFGQAGNYLVPWNKQKFKNEFDRFVQSLPKIEEEDGK